jgi:hypothetical protein
MSIVSAFLLRDRYFIYPNKQTTAGLWVAQPDFMCLPLDASPESIGCAILASLAQSHGTVPHPSDWSALSKPRLAAAGVRSERAFMAGASLVEIERGERLIFNSTRNGGSSGDDRGFVRLPEGQVTLPLDSVSQVVGEVFLKALGECALET